MKQLSSGLRVSLAMAFCAALLAPSALADNGKQPPEERPGNSANAPGHSKDTEAPPAQAPVAATPPPPPAPPAPPPVEPQPVPPPAESAQSEASRPDPPAGAAANEKPKQSESHRPEKPEKPKSTPQASGRPSRPSAPPSAGGSTAHSKVLICHATGSATNPYVVISISVNAWSKGAGHGAHADDVFVDWSWPGDPRQKNEALCPTAPPPGTTTTTSTTSTSTAASSTTTTGTSGTGDPKDAVKPAAAQDDPQASGPTLAPPASHATHAPPHAVLSASAALAATTVRGTLPFTGVPLGVLALLGIGLIVGGLALRRRRVGVQG